jgi:hypothetical protein
MRMIQARVASEVVLKAEFGFSGIDARVFSPCSASGRLYMPKKVLRASLAAVGRREHQVTEWN